MTQSATSPRQPAPSSSSPEGWTKIIEPKSTLFNLKLKQTWAYRDLIYMFIRRDLVVQYKQTILGPLWFIIQPILTSVTFTIIFGRIAKIPADGIPHFLFYLAGTTCWQYFSTCLTQTSATFTANQNVFGKVYFPRITVPISQVISNLIKFAIQFTIFLSFYFYFIFKGAQLNINFALFLLPVCIIIMAGLGLGFGMLFSSFTTKYRDLKFLLTFGVQLWMYATPIIYPLSSISAYHRWWLALNPMTGIVTTFKYGFFSKDIFDWHYLLYSFVFMLILLLVSTIVFNRVEKNFMDTV